MDARSRNEATWISTSVVSFCRAVSLLSNIMAVERVYECLVVERKRDTLVKFGVLYSLFVYWRGDNNYTCFVTVAVVVPLI